MNKVNGGESEGRNERRKKTRSERQVTKRKSESKKTRMTEGGVEVGKCPLSGVKVTQRTS